MHILQTNYLLIFSAFFSPEHASDGPFYLKPKGNWKYGAIIWFENRAIGWNTLSKRFKEMCKDAGLVENYSNHSGRVTAVTRLNDAGVPEKAIMKRSGHRSIEGVRTYQREDVNANVAVSSILSGATNASAVFDDVDDETLVNACVEYEKSVNSNLDLSGMLQAASVHGNVHININISK